MRQVDAEAGEAGGHFHERRDQDDAIECDEVIVEQVPGDATGAQTAVGFAEPGPPLYANMMGCVRGMPWLSLANREYDHRTWRNALPRRYAREWHRFLESLDPIDRPALTEALTRFRFSDETEARQAYNSDPIESARA